MGTMNRERLGIIAVLVLGALALLGGLQSAIARQLVYVPNGQQVRFQLIGNEPIAAPDGRGLVQGWSVVVFKDRKADRCYVVFKHGTEIAVEELSTCPH
jgi:hypothetical protein